MTNISIEIGGGDRMHESIPSSIASDVASRSRPLWVETLGIVVVLGEKGKRCERGWVVGHSTQMSASFYKVEAQGV